MIKKILQHALIIIQYNLSALWYNGVNITGLINYLKQGLMAAPDAIFSHYNPYFKVVNWEKVADKFGTIIKILPGGWRYKQYFGKHLHCLY